MVRLSPPICDKTNDYTICLQVIKNIYTLRYELLYIEQVKVMIKDDIEELIAWKKQKLDKEGLKK